jgi:hypothetical protein
MKTEMVLETLVYLPFNDLTRLLAEENFIEFSGGESFKLYMAINVLDLNFVSVLFQVMNRHSQIILNLLQIVLH